MVGLGHPLVDALIHALRKPAFQGSVSGRLGEGSVYAHYLVQHRSVTGQLQGRVFNFVYDSLANEVRTLPRFEVENGMGTDDDKDAQDISNARERIETALQNAIIEWLPDRQSRAGLQVSLIGLHSIGKVR
jgi:tRNA U34 5-carboxymethylaminomethyl modifying GTPase MnmE/TrmE